MSRATVRFVYGVAWLLFSGVAVVLTRADPAANDVGIILYGEGRCPKVCACSGTTVDCSHRGLTQVPRNLPLDTEKL